MCDNCKSEEEILAMIGIEPHERRDPISLAKKRLRCYYECVTSDMLLDDGEDDEDDIWNPEM